MEEERTGGKKTDKGRKGRNKRGGDIDRVKTNETRLKKHPGVSESGGSGARGGRGGGRKGRVEEIYLSALSEQFS